MDEPRLGGDWLDRVAEERADPAPPVVERIRLADLLPQFGVFTHALLFTHGGLDFDYEDPLRAFGAERPQAVKDVGYYDMPAPIFEGAARNAREEIWDRRLFLIRRVHLAEWIAWLAAMVFTDRAAGVYLKPAPQALQIIDPAETRPECRLPLLNITAFGLDGNRSRLAFRRSARFPGDRARVVGLPVDPRTRAEGARVLAGAARPFRPPSQRSRPS